jgi:phosphatidylserine/phosphatidylglycerophosphate/cardiolipin synthase-like enzyme
MNDLTSSSQAGFSIPGFELIYDAPIETSLQADDLRSSAVVWTEMFDQAQQQIDIAQFYVASQSGSRLDEVLRALKAAAARGVRIRFLLEEQGLKRSTADTLAELQSITGLSLRTIAFSRLTGGIMHAKYLLIDGKRAFVGSQNFDWRALEHIHETGVLIDDALVVQQIAAIFNHDWEMQPLLASLRLVNQQRAIAIIFLSPARQHGIRRASPTRKSCCRSYLPRPNHTYTCR